jgi:hypothetical protein
VWTGCLLCNHQIVLHKFMIKGLKDRLLSVMQCSVTEICCGVGGQPFLHTLQGSNGAV